MARAQLLIIDDRPENLRVAVDLLEAYSFVVLTAREGETGLARAAAVRPDAILLDVQMPGIDGYEVCRRLKANPDTRAIPVLFMTVLDQPEQKVRAFEAGGVDYVTKPLEPTELLARLRAHLEIRGLRDTLEAQVAARTEALAAAVVQREQLVEMVRAQSDQLRDLTRAWLDDQQRRNQGLAQRLREDVAARLRLVRSHLEHIAALRHMDARPPPLPTDRTDPIAGHLADADALLATALVSAEQLGGHLRDGDDEADAARPAANPLLRLSTREYEVLQLMVAGKSNKEIAARLRIAPSTTSTYRLRIMEKLEVDDASALLRVALRFGIVAE
ncbi:MAG: response regulator [Acidobacteriota bacterium]